MTWSRGPHPGPYYSVNAYRKPNRRHWRDTGCTKLAHELAKARIAAHLKQDQVAAKLGVSRSRIAQWEGAKRPVPWKYIEILTDLFDTHDAWDVEPYTIPKKLPMFARMVR